jgi:hypothetical protein
VASFPTVAGATAGILLVVLLQVFLLFRVQDQEMAFLLTGARFQSQAGSATSIPQSEQQRCLPLPALLPAHPFPLHIKIVHWVSGATSFAAAGMITTTPLPSFFILL